VQSKNENSEPFTRKEVRQIRRRKFAAELFGLI